MPAVPPPPPKRILCGAVMEGEIPLDGSWIQVDTCAVGAQATTPCYNKQVQKAVFYTLPMDGECSAALYMEKAAHFNSVMELLWCPVSTNPNDTFVVGSVFQGFGWGCAEQGGFMTFNFPGPSGHIHVVKVSDSPHSLATDPKCAIIMLKAEDEYCY